MCPTKVFALFNTTWLPPKKMAYYVSSKYVYFLWTLRYSKFETITGGSGNVKRKFPGRKFIIITETRERGRCP